MRTVKDILESKGNEVRSIDQSETVYEAISLMDTHHIGSLVVMHEGKLVGVITERDYCCKVTLRGKQSRTTKVAEIMSDKVVVTSPDSSMNECMALMTGRRMRHLPVMHEGELLGLISIGDVVKEVIEEQNVLIEQLESYIHS